jgi:transcription termination factor Rho
MPETFSGILKLTRQGAGVLRDLTRSSSNVVTVPARFVREYKLVEGATVTGPARQGKQGLELIAVESVCGQEPAAFQTRKPLANLIAIDPSDRFNLGITGDPSTRIVDLIAPIGKGTRGLIVSPPKAGKTMLLEQIAKGIRASRPEARIVVLLIDERPEEVTYFRRAAAAEVFASSSDQSVKEHIELSELMLAHVRTELECGCHVVVLMDSLTRLVRAFNRQGAGTGRTLSGGLDAGATDIPRRFFGLARNIENGGSATLIATALIDTNSRMDQLIYEEFKGTGNSEIVLDRALAEARIFPAINVRASGTRKEDRLYHPDDYRRLVQLRRMLANYNPKDALVTLLKLIEKYSTNEELLQSIPVED